MAKHATLYRMVMSEHICPYGIKSKDLLKREGYVVDDHHLTTREETDAFLQKHDVKTTPQTFIEGKRIGGFDDVVKHLGKYSFKQEGKSYQPVIAIFAAAFLMALALTPRFTVYAVLTTFVGVSMCVLAMMKLKNLYSFSNQFVTYDLLAMREVRYAYAYPFAELFAGVGMLAGGWLVYVAAPVAFVIGGIGAVSVMKAVYIDRRELSCACVGGGSNVPLGALSLTENLMMVTLAVWMIAGQIM